MSRPFDGLLEQLAEKLGALEVLRADIASLCARVVVEAGAASPASALASALAAAAGEIATPQPTETSKPSSKTPPKIAPGHTRPAPKPAAKQAPKRPAPKPATKKPAATKALEGRGRGRPKLPPRPATKRLDAAQASSDTPVANSATGDRAVEPASSALFGGTGAARAAGAPTLRRAIVELLGKQGPMKSADIARALNHPPDPTRSALFKLAREGVLEKGQGPEAPYSVPSVSPGGGA